MNTMQPKITGENDERVGISVIDDNDVEHLIEMEFDGQIKYHAQDAYDEDPEGRTDGENETFDRVRDYARWYVTQETEHETAPWYLDTDQLETIREIVSQLSGDDFRKYFYDYYRQLAGEYDDDLSQPHPDPVSPGEAFNEYREYKLDIYLTADRSDIDATSGVHTMYYADYNEDRLIKSDDPYPEREPDGRLEHVVIDVDWDQFRDFVDYHLRCQIRDSYHARGEDPPEEYRVLGPGTDHMMIRYMHLDVNPPYHDYNANVDGYCAEDEFNAGMFASLLDLI